MRDQCLCAEVVVEGERFDEFLDAAADVALVPPGVDALHVWEDGGEELVDLVEAGLVFGGDFGREGLVECADALEGEDSVCARGVSSWIDVVVGREDTSSC